MHCIETHEVVDSQNLITYNLGTGHTFKPWLLHTQGENPVRALNRRLVGAQIRCGHTGAKDKPCSLSVYRLCWPISCGLFYGDMAEIQTQNWSVRNRNSDHYTPFSVIFISQEQPVGQHARHKCTGENKAHTPRLGGRYTQRPDDAAAIARIAQWGIHG